MRNKRHIKNIDKMRELAREQPKFRFMYSKLVSRIRGKVEAEDVFKQLTNNKKNIKEIL